MNSKRARTLKEGDTRSGPVGHISAQRAALEVLQTSIDKRYQETFLEELIVRRELSDNFCFYNMNYDKFEGFPEWAKKTLNEHRNDRRDHIYTLNNSKLPECMMPYGMQHKGK